MPMTDVDPATAKTISPASPPAAATVLFKPDVELMANLLQSLSAEGCPLFVYVNGPLVQAAEDALKAFPDLRLLRSPENIGQGAGLNAVVAAAAAAGYKHIALFDQDSTPDRAFATHLLGKYRALLRDRPRLAALGPLLVPPKATGYLPIKYWRRPPRAGEPPGAVEFLPTSGTLLSIAAFEDVGPFRADYFIGGIDVEWGFRAWARGWSMAVDETITMDHRWGDERGRNDVLHPQFVRQSAPRAYYYLRNAVDSMKLGHMPLRWKWRQAVRMTGQIGLALVAPDNSAITAKLIWRALRDGYAGRLGPSPQGLEK